MKLQRLDLVRILTKLDTGKYSPKSKEINSRYQWARQREHSKGTELEL